MRNWPTVSTSIGAVLRTVETAGRTVAFSGLTVAVSLASLVVFPLYFLRSFAYAGVGVLLVAMLTSIVTLPALLHVLGHRVNTWSFGSASRSQDSKGWAAVAERVVRRPIVVAVTVVAILLLAGTPFLGVQFGNPDERVLPDRRSGPGRHRAHRRRVRLRRGRGVPVVLDAASPGLAVDDYAAQVSTIADDPTCRRSRRQLGRRHARGTAGSGCRALRRRRRRLAQRGARRGTDVHRSPGRGS